MKHWRHHPDDDQLDITVEALIESKELFQTIIHQVKEAIMATLEEASAEAQSVDAAVVAYVTQLQSDLAAAQQPDPNAQAAVDAISAATATLQALLPVAPVEAPPADGSTTNPDGSVTNADGSVTPAPAV